MFLDFPHQLDLVLLEHLLDPEVYFLFAGSQLVVDVGAQSLPVSDELLLH